MGLAHFPEELDQGLELGGAEMPELAYMAIADLLVELIEQGYAAFGDSDLHDAAILGDALAINQAALDQTIDETGDIGSSRDKPCGKMKRGHFFRLGGLQQS
jgi:hypothetical protein